jgi:hypothetical protein
MRLPPANAYVETAGTLVVADASGDCTLSSSTTYDFPLQFEDHPLGSVHLKWDATIVAVVTFESSNRDPSLTDIYAASTGGVWVKEDPSTAYVAITSGAGTVSNMTVTIPGGTAGGAIINIGNLGTRRLRAHVVVTTGSKLSVMPHGKAA